MESNGERERQNGSKAKKFNCCCLDKTAHFRHKMGGFENVVGGKLKLKGAAIEKREKKKKKKKKKKKTLKDDDDDDERKREYVELNEDDSDDDEHFKKRTSSREKKEDENNNIKKTLDTRTDAEKAHEERSRQQRKKRILEHAELSHKDKVRLFNEKLGRLSEHHDIPKVGPG